MAHVALMSVPLHGHVNPLLGVAAELVARGHRVTFATGADFAPLIEEAGAVPVRYRTTFPGTDNRGRSWLPADDDGRLAVDAFAKERDAALPQVAAAYTADVPDLVVYDTVTGHAPLLARAWGVPEVQFSPTHAFPAGTRGPGVGGGPGALSDTVPCIVAMPPSLQFEADKTGPHHTYVGPVTWRRHAHGTWTPPPDGRPVALVSLGTTYNTRTDLFRQAAEAVRALDGPDWHVVVATGHGTAPEALEDLPPGTEVHEWVPQVSVLARARLFITAGGTGSVLEGLTAGVPLVVLPQAIEQFLTARQVDTLGLGRALPPQDVTAQSLRSVVREVTGDPGIGGRLARMRAEIARCGGARSAADVIEARLPTDGSRPPGAAPRTSAAPHGSKERLG
ncbi:nucleotide disphospho-sugar-binding domain-containing protein [Streptomyces achromogenes]|uniref:nucleotide disphospho-sugar-binding domain-containing protein n=1 Tax=Streptomyces achromogenes TaxID=67255 RepID=UPI00368E9215